MASVTFRSEVVPEKVASVAPEKAPEKVTTGNVSVKLPFSSYESENTVPYTAEYFGLKDIYHEPGALFNEEIEKIDEYFRNRVKRGQMVDDIDMVRDKIKHIEKIIGCDKSERSIVRLAKVAAYIDFLRKTDNINLENAKYG